MKHVLEILEERGLVESVTSEALRERLHHPITLYCGFDPTADSLHVGNLVAMMVMAWFQRCGHQVVALVGGATGLIGDPSGKSVERPLLDRESAKRNLAGIGRDLRAVLDCGESVEVVDNLDWYGEMSVVDFLRDVGRHFRLGPMLGKECVRSRMESEEGISYAEFSYQLLQAWDFHHLQEQRGVELQIGGGDQWGNITAGVELIRRKSGKAAFGLTYPLLTRSDGKKFGKSEGGAIWLSPQKLSPYDFYQYFMRVPDADVSKMMRCLTFMEMEEIAQWERYMQEEGYEPNSAQRHLAEVVTRMVHGEEGYKAAVRVTEGMRPGSEARLDAATLQEIAKEMPFQELKRSEVVGHPWVDLFVISGMAASKGEARRLIRGGGAYSNNQKIVDEVSRVTPEDLVEGGLLLLAVGKKRKLLVQLI